MRISSEAEYRLAIERANVLCDTSTDPWAIKEFNILTDAIYKWENDHSILDKRVIP